MDLDEPSTPEISPETRSIEFADTEAAAGSTSGPSMPASVLGRGASVGRYLVLGPLGHGGMGQVYSAYDPDLDRRIALKVLRTSPRRSRRLESRLLEEAKTLARLNHPNVVTVFDVGMVRLDAGPDRVFIAMELVEGANLARWAEAEKRSLAEILRVFRQAGTGLAAAHEAGVVHLDFKPGNVLVGEDGRARVCDFGLARPAPPDAGDAGPEQVIGIADLEAAEAELRLQRQDRPTGQAKAAAGTPAFMAPEQWAGGEVGAAADQFAFCIALARVLGLPLAGPGGSSESAAQRDRSVPTEDQMAVRSRIPARVEKVIRRGTRADPGERYPSMDQLLADLEPGRWRRWAVPAAAIVGAAALFMAWRGRVEDVCAGGPALASEVWGAASSRQLSEAFLATGRPFAGDALRTSISALEQRHEAWIEQFGEACRAHHRGEQSDRLLDRRMACLEERRQELGILVQSLVEKRQVVGSVAAVLALPSLDRCRDTAALLSPLPLPESTAAAAVAEARKDLARLRAWRLAGRYQETLEAAAPAVENARGLGHWPLIAEALLERGLVEEVTQQAMVAEATFRETLLAAEAGRHDRVAVEAFLRLVRLASYERGDAGEAANLAAMGGALLEQLGERRRLQAMLENHLGLASLQAGEAEAALQHHRRALELLAPSPETPGAGEPVPGGDRLAWAGTHVRLGNAARATGDLAMAEEEYGAALGLYRAVHGDAHPEVAVALERLGGVAAERGQLEDAGQLRNRALGILRAAYGEDHPQVADALVNLGAVQLKLDAFEQALSTFRQVEQIYLHSRGESHPKMAAVLGNLGSAYLGMGDGEQALECYRRALDLRASTLGPDHPATGLMRFNLAAAHNELGLPELALAGHRLALGNWRRRLGDRHILVAHGLTGVGRSLVDLERPAEAVPLLEQAMEIWTGSQSDPIYPARTGYHLARALWETGSRQRALALAEDARATFEEAAGARKYLAAVSDWLDARRPPENAQDESS